MKDDLSLQFVSDPCPEIIGRPWCCSCRKTIMQVIPARGQSKMRGCFYGKTNLVQDAIITELFDQWLKISSAGKSDIVSRVPGKRNITAVPQVAVLYLGYRSLNFPFIHEQAGSIHSEYRDLDEFEPWSRTQ